MFDMGPLEGIVVVDAGWGMPSAVAGMLLADYGARVVKVERPGGGPTAQSITRAAWDQLGYRSSGLVLHRTTPLPYCDCPGDPNDS